MAFASGSVSFRRFTVSGGEVPAAPTQEILDKLAGFTIDTDRPGVPEELEFGWCGGRHIYDREFTFENNVYADALHFGLRIDTNKVPGDLKKALLAMEEAALAKASRSGLLSKAQKQEAKDKVRGQLEEELKSGKHRKSNLLPVLWDLAHNCLYAAPSGSRLECLLNGFETTFDLQLRPLTAGTLAMDLLAAWGQSQAFESLRPTQFVCGPEGEVQMPEYPWMAGGEQAKDFLGNEFLMWLWHRIETEGGTIATERGEIAVVLEKAMDLECAYGQTGRDGIRGDGPSRTPEARQALKVGKLPRKAGLIVETGGSQYEFLLDPERMAVNGCKLPEVEDAETARAVFEERIKLVHDLGQGLDALYATFLRRRISPQWEETTRIIREWATACSPTGVLEGKAKSSQSKKAPVASAA